MNLGAKVDIKIQPIQSVKMPIWMNVRFTLIVICLKSERYPFYPILANMDVFSTRITLVLTNFLIKCDENMLFVLSFHEKRLFLQHK